MSACTRRTRRNARQRVPLLEQSLAIDDDHPPADIGARANAWLVSGNPKDLWPSIDTGRLPAAAAAIERTVADILAGRHSSLGAANGHDAVEIGIAALPTGTGPFLGWHVEKGLLDVSDSLAKLLARHLDHGRRRIERITRNALPALVAIREAGVDPCVIKGFHSAHEYFPEPGLRPFADVDVVIRLDEIERTERALASLGFTGHLAMRAPFKRDWSAPGENGRTWSLEFWHERSHWRIDLHDGVNFPDLARYGVRLDAPEYLNGSSVIEGVRVRVATQPLLLAILATHLSIEVYQRRLIRLIELANMVRRDTQLGRLDWAQAEELLDRGGAKRFAYPALALVERLAPGTIDGTFLSRARSSTTRLTRHVVDRLTPTFPLLPDRISLAQRLMWVAGPVDAIRRVGLMFSPVETESFSETVRTYRGRVRRLLDGRVSWKMPRAPLPPDDHASG